MTFDQKTLQPTYQMIIGEAGESCGFYIADRLGMPKEMLQTAVRYAYGESAVSKYQFQNEKNNLEHHRSSKIRKSVKNKKDIKLQDKFRRSIC